MTTGTPRTDEYLRAFDDKEEWARNLNTVDFARELERENARLRDQLHSARYLLDECGAGQLSQISGLPEGVVVSALENVLSNDQGDSR
jgi:hypothetical protein